MAATGNPIDDFLKSKGSPMAGLGNVFTAVGKKYGVDPRLLVGISGIESSFGKHLYGSYNAWGWGPGKPFSSWQQGITTVAQGLKSGYLSQGLTDPYKIASKYAPASDGNNPQHWADTVSQFMREMGATVPGSTVTGSSLSPATQAAASEQRSNLGLQNALMGNLSSIALHGGKADPVSMLANVASGAAYDRSTAGNTPSTVPASKSVPGGAGSVTIRPGADRAGVGLSTGILDFARKVSAQFGSPLEITTGSNHNQYVVNTHRQSAHWTGNAADIAYGTGTGPNNIDPQLTALGRAALIAAGMDPATAMKQTGGLFNVGGYQVIFNSSIGGNHYNHLHIGLNG